MEAWLKAQEVVIELNEAALLPRPSSAPVDPYTRTSLLSPPPAAPAFGSLSSSPLNQPYSVTTAAAGGISPASSPFRGSFLAGANQDLLAAGALASCGLTGSITSKYSTALAGTGVLGGKASMIGGAAAGLVEGNGVGAPSAAGSVGAYSIAAANEAQLGSPGGLARIPLPLVSLDSVRYWYSPMLWVNSHSIEPNSRNSACCSCCIHGWCRL